MSDFKKHSAFNLLLALPVLCVAAFFTLDPDPVFLITFASAFAYATLFMNPDLYMVHQIKLVSIRGAFTLPFRYYSKIFPKKIAHSPFFGSASRIVWLSVLALVCFLIVYRTLPTEKSFWVYYNKYKIYLVYGLAGICSADWCYLLFDQRKK